MATLGQPSWKRGFSSTEIVDEVQRKADARRGTRIGVTKPTLAKRKAKRRRKK